MMLHEKAKIHCFNIYSKHDSLSELETNAKQQWTRRSAVQRRRVPVTEVQRRVVRSDRSFDPCVWRASLTQRVHREKTAGRVLMHKVNLGLPVSGAPGNPIPSLVTEARRERLKRERQRARERETWSSLMDVWYVRDSRFGRRTSRGRALLMGP